MSSQGAEAFKRVSLDKLNALVGFAETTHCRRTRLLGYFGEKLEAAKCGNCDNCLSPPQGSRRQRHRAKAFVLVYRTGERFGAAHLIDILTGR